MSSLKLVPAATPSSLATARADGVLTFRLRIRACFAARNTRLSGSAPRAAWSRGAWIWEGPRGEPAAPPHPAGRCCARRASAHAHPAAVPRPCPADQRPLQSGAQAAAAAQVPSTGRQEARGYLCGLPSTPAADCRELGGSPLRARPPGRLQARAPACCPRALRRAGRRRPIAHERRGFVPGSLSVQDGRCDLRPRREGRCGGRAVHPRLSTHQVPLSRLAHTYQLALSKRSLSPKQTAPAPKGSRWRTRSAPVPFRTAIGAGV